MFLSRPGQPPSTGFSGETLEARLPLAIDLGGEPVFAPGTSAAYVAEVEEFNLGPGGNGNGSGPAERWTVTATDGGGLGQGDATTVTWSIVRDGDAISGGASDLVAFFSGIYGQTDNDDDFTEEPWFDDLRAGFDRWSEVSGLEFVYEPADDGSTSSGVLGQRGDIRVGGRYIDGDFGVLGFNAFPNGGDMVLDTGDDYFANTGSNSIRLRNVVGHELGHGLGFSHVQSSDAAFLMEPTITLAFDGPQIDDILAAQRAYGDVNEENGGNDNTLNATLLGSIPHGGTSSVGSSVSDSTTQVAAAAVDFVAIDDDADLDVYSFTVPSQSQVTVTVSPMGPTYQEGLQGGSQSTFNTKSLSDLQLELIQTNGTTVLHSVDANGIGQNEAINSVPLPTAGTYFIRISGAQNQVQLYSLDVSVAQAPFVNSDPDASNDAALTTAGTPVTIDVLANDTDPDGHSLSVQSVSQGANGSVNINGNGTLRYAPNVNFSGNDSFTYVASDGNGGTDSATVNVTVNPANVPPIARNDSAATAEDTAVSVAVLGNDTDADGDSLSVQSVTQGAHGSVTINGNGTLRYSPNANFHGSDSFTYVASDGNGGTNSATVNVAVNSANDPPIARNDNAATAEDTAVSIAVLGNDTDADGDGLSVQSVTHGANGSVTISANGTVRYRPNSNFNGSDSFTYVASDGNGSTDSATVNITVNPLNDPPIARSDNAVTDEETAVSVPVLGNDSDADGDSLSVQSVTQANNGVVVVNGNGTLTYTPSVGFSGQDSFAYTATDGQGGVDTATVTVSVNMTNRADFVAVSDDAIYLARSTGDAFTTESFALPATNWRNVRKADVNGDNIDDLIGRSASVLWVARSTGQAFVAERWGAWSARTQWSFFEVADVDADGDADIVGRTRGGAWWIGRSTGTRFINEKWGAWSAAVNWRDVNTADVDGDGNTDIVGRSSGQWWVARSDGTSFTNERWGAWSRQAVWQHVRIADVDGNGMDDILGMTGGRWWVARSTGNSFANESWGAWSRNALWLDVRIGDFDGDGRDDVAGRAGGQWWIARSTGSAFVNQQWGRWSSEAVWFDVIVSDFDGDGRDDIAGRTGNRWWVAVSSGSSFVNELWERWTVVRQGWMVGAGNFAV